MQVSGTKNSYLNSFRLIRRDAGLSLITQASLGFSYFGIYAVIFNLYLLRLGYGLRYISSVNASGQLVFAISSLIIGLFSKRSGSRTGMVLGMGINLLAFCLLPLFKWNQIPFGEIWLMAVYSLSWLGLALVIVHIIPFLINTTSTTERGLVFGLVGAILSLSGFAGSLFGGLLPGYFAGKLGLTLNSPEPYRYTLMLTAIFIIPGLIAMIGTSEQGTENQIKTNPGTESKIPLGLIILFTLVMLLMRTGEGSVRTFFNVYLDTALNESTSLIAFLSGAGQLLAIPAALATPWLIKVLNLRRTLLLGIFGMACSLLPLAFIPKWQAAGLGFLGMMALTSFAVPAFGIYHQENLPLKWRTVMSGTATMAVGLSWALISFGGGFIISKFSYPIFFMTAIICTACGGLIFWITSLRFDTKPIVKQEIGLKK